MAAIYTVADGCAANLGAQMSILMHQVLLSDATPQEQILYSFLTEKIIAPMTYQLQEDMLTGNPAHDPIKDAYLHTFRVSPVAVVQKLKESLQPSDVNLVLHMMEKQHDGLTEYLTAHDFETQAPMLAVYSVLQEVTPTVLTHPRMQEFSGQCRALMDAFEAEKLVQSQQEGERAQPTHQTRHRSLADGRRAILEELAPNTTHADRLSRTSNKDGWGHDR